MFQPDEPRGMRNSFILWVIMVVMLYTLFSVLLNSCTTVPSDPQLGCPDTEIVAQDPYTEEVLEHYLMAIKGCQKHYGERACLIKLTRVSYRNYHAICRRR